MLRGIIAVLIGAVSYGTLSTIAKLSYLKGFNAGNATVFQIVFGFIVLFMISLFSGKKIIGNLPPKIELLKLAFGGSAIALTSLFYYSCVQYIPASIGIILLFQFIWIGFVLDRIFNGVKPSKTQLLTLLILLIGTVFASGVIGGTGGGHLNFKGLVLGLLAALSYSSYIFINGKLKKGTSPVVKSTYMLGVSFKIW